MRLRLTMSYIRQMTWHNRALWSTSDNLLYVPKNNIEQFRNSLSYSGSKIWNSIPENIKQSESLPLFKRKYLAWSSTKVNKSKFISHITDSVYDVVYFVCMIVYIFC